MSDQTPFHELSNLRKYAEHIRWIVDTYSMGEPVKDKLRLTAEVLDAEAKEHDALLAVVKVTQIELGMSVPELLRIVAKDIETDSEIEAVDVLAMWLNRIADELEKTLAALPEYLK